MTLNTERRNFIAGVGVAAASTAVLAGTQALAQGNQQTGGKAMPYQAKPMHAIRSEIYHRHLGKEFSSAITKTTTSVQ